MRQTEDSDLRYFPIPPMCLPNGTPAQLTCMGAVHDGLRHLSRRDLERLVKAVAAEVNSDD